MLILIHPPVYLQPLTNANRNTIFEIYLRLQLQVRKTSTAKCLGRVICTLTLLSKKSSLTPKAKAKAKGQTKSQSKFSNEVHALTGREG